MNNSLPYAYYKRYRRLMLILSGIIWFAYIIYINAWVWGYLTDNLYSGSNQ